MKKSQGRYFMVLVGMAFANSAFVQADEFQGRHGEGAPDQRPSFGGNQGLGGGGGHGGPGESRGPESPQPPRPEPGFPQAPLPQPGYPQPPRPEPGFPHGPFPQPGYPQPPRPEPGFPHGPFPQPGYPQPPRPEPGFPHGPFPRPGLTQTTMECRSSGYTYRACPAPAGMEITYARLISIMHGSNCYGQGTWGFAADSVWVDHGCQGVFEVEMRPDRDGDHSYRQTEDLFCRSNHYGYNECFPQTLRRIDNGMVIQVVHESNCAPGNYGITNDRVWVNNGCQAIFRLNSY